MTAISAFIVAREHGTRATYVSGCRCEACTRANTIRYAKRREAVRELAATVRPTGPAIPGTMRRGGRDVAILTCPGANGQPCVKPGTWLKGATICMTCIERATVWDGLVDARRVRRHLRKLSRAGVGYKSVADACDVGSTVLSDVLAGTKRRIRASTERRVLAVDADAIADHALVDASRSRELYADLRARGFTIRHLSRLIGFASPLTAWQLAARDRVTAATAQRIERVWQRAKAGEFAPERGLVDASEERAYLVHLLDKGVSARWLSERLGFAVVRRATGKMFPKNRDAVRALRAELEEIARSGTGMPDGWEWEASTLLTAAFGFERSWLVRGRARRAS